MRRNTLNILATIVITALITSSLTIALSNRESKEVPEIKNDKDEFALALEFSKASVERFGSYQLVSDSMAECNRQALIQRDYSNKQNNIVINDIQSEVPGMEGRCLRLLNRRGQKVYFEAYPNVGFGGVKVSLVEFDRDSHQMHVMKFVGEDQDEVSTFSGTSFPLIYSAEKTKFLYRAWDDSLYAADLINESIRKVVTLKDDESFFNFQGHGELSDIHWEGENGFRYAVFRPLGDGEMPAEPYDNLIEFRNGSID